MFQDVTLITHVQARIGYVCVSNRIWQWRFSKYIIINKFSFFSVFSSRHLCSDEWIEILFFFFWHIICNFWSIKSFSILVIRNSTVLIFFRDIKFPALHTSDVIIIVTIRDNYRSWMSETPAIAIYTHAQKEEPDVNIHTYVVRVSDMNSSSHREDNTYADWTLLTILFGVLFLTK